MEREDQTKGPYNHLVSAACGRLSDHGEEKPSQRATRSSRRFMPIVMEARANPKLRWLLIMAEAKASPFCWC